jgi:hypothetical protein
MMSIDQDHNDCPPSYSLPDTLEIMPDGEEFSARGMPSRRSLDMRQSRRRSVRALRPLGVLLAPITLGAIAMYNLVLVFGFILVWIPAAITTLAITGNLRPFRRIALARVTPAR